MVELVYVGDPGKSHTDPPVGQLEPGATIYAEDDVGQRLLATGAFAVATEVAEDAATEDPRSPEKAKRTRVAAQPEPTAQED